MAETWTLDEICAKIRAITGDGTTEDISADDLKDRVNDFYRNIIPLDVHSPDFEGWFEVDFTDGVGEYDVSQEYLKLETPMRTKDSDDAMAPVTFFQDKDQFYKEFPEEATPTESRPQAVLLYGNQLHPRPVPDATYSFKAAALVKPTALEADTAPVDLRMGMAIAYGVGGEMELEDGDEENGEKLLGIYGGLVTKLNRKQNVQKASNQRANPRW